MTNALRKTTIGGAEVAHTSSFTDEELRTAFTYLYRLQSLRYDQTTSLDGQKNYTMKPADENASLWEFVSLSPDIPVCITPEFDLSQMISMAKTALVVTQTIKNMRMAGVAI